MGARRLLRNRQRSPVLPPAKRKLSGETRLQPPAPSVGPLQGVFPGGHSGTLNGRSWPVPANGLVYARP
jgi:hypothetical protein